MNIALAILWKDLLSEWRSRDRVIAMLLFALLMAMVFHFALPGQGRDALRAQMPGLLWTAYIFAAVLGLNRAFALELENDALSGLALAPGNRGFIFLGKAAANFILIGVVQSLTAAAFAVLFDAPIAAAAGPLAGVVALGTFGVCTVGTLFSAMSVRTRFRDMLLPILLLPALFPVLAGAVGGTRAALAGEPIPFDALQLLIVVDGIYFIVSFLAFDYILDE